MPTDQFIRRLSYWLRIQVIIVAFAVRANITAEGKKSFETRDGWHFGKVLISAMNNSAESIEIEYQNKYLAARKNGKTLAIAPDLIAIMDRENAEPLMAEMLTYGLRVKFIGYSATSIMRRPECLKVFGPRMFGYDEDCVTAGDIF